MTGHRWSGVFCGILVCTVASTGAAQKLNHNSYLGQPPPKITSEQQHWLGWDKRVTLADLTGKVVWLQFNF